MSANCIFCKIIKKEIPAEIVFENENVIAFKDLNPQAPFHFLVIPKQHLETVNDLQTNSEIGGKVISASAKIAKKFGFSESGYRTIFNCNKDGGQEVFHLHLHLLGGRKLNWPPG